MRYRGKRVLITGASSGIGAACAREFAKQGANLLLCARRQEVLEQLAVSLETEYQVAAQVLVSDISHRTAFETAFQQLPDQWRAIDVLVNNAGFALGLDKIQDSNPEDWDRMIDTNIKGLLYVTRAVLAEMLARNCGHIINIGSIAGDQPYSGGVVYCATKAAVHMLTDGLKMDVHGTPIRLSMVNPGVVKTEFSDVRFAGDCVRAAAVYAGVDALMPEDIADAVVYCATRPAHVDVREMSILPTVQTAAHMCCRQE